MLQKETLIIFNYSSQKKTGKNKSI